MDKYIFLDIDGVLATPDSIKDGLWSLSDKRQEFLGYVLKNTGAKIILSSSWRLHSLETTKEHMLSEGFLFVDDLIGITIRAYHYLDKAQKIHLSIPRGVEIKQWIDTNIHSNQGKNFIRKTLGKDFNYVILDDDSDMLLEHKDNFIKTDSDLGLTKELADLAIQILNKQI